MKTKMGFAFAVLFLTSVAVESSVYAQVAAHPAPRPMAAATPATTSSAAGASQGSGAQKVDVEGIKQKYWARGDQNELRVVQNRLYSKSGKLELSAFGGTIGSDAFLSIKNAGAGITYHLSEYVAMDLLYWKDLVSDSAAAKTLTEAQGFGALTNKPRQFYGASLTYSPLYGKLSVFGASIIYFDIHGMVGAGMSATANGNYATPFAGIGQEIYLSPYLALRLDYRLTYYRESLVQNVNPADTATYGQVAKRRDSWSNVIVLGLSFFPWHL